MTKQKHPCPSCGRCPTCGRGGPDFQPYYVPMPYYPPTYTPNPWWLYPTITCGTTSDITLSTTTGGRQQ